MRALQEDLLERQRHAETPNEAHQVLIATREGDQSKVPTDATKELYRP